VYCVYITHLLITKWAAQKAVNQQKPNCI